jgi:hypothetical protein
VHDSDFHITNSATSIPAKESGMRGNSENTA